jgi:hypothetical protein
LCTDTSPDTSPDTTSDTSPDTSPDTTSDTSPDTSPDTLCLSADVCFDYGMPCGQVQTGGLFLS